MCLTKLFKLHVFFKDEGNLFHTTDPLYSRDCLVVDNLQNFGTKLLLPVLLVFIGELF